MLRLASLALFLVFLPALFAQEETASPSVITPCLVSSTNTLTGDSGTFGCNSYGNNVDISWYITSPSAHRHVRVTITNLNTEEGVDRLTAVNGENTTDSFEPFRFSLSGQVDTYTFSSSGPGVIVQFHSDSSVTGGGFTATYETFGYFLLPCYDQEGYVAFEPSDVLVKEFGCGAYANQASTAWLLTAPKTEQRIALWFERFATEAGNDVVTVYDGDSESHSVLQAISGNHTFQGPFQSSGPNLYVKFQADYSIIVEGFMISAIAQGNYSNTCYEDAEYTIQQDSGKIGCDSYVNDVDITWTIEAPNQNERLILNFTKLQTERYDDEVYICDGYNDDFECSSYSGDYSSSSNLPSFSTSGPAAFVRFRSDYSNTDKGFEIQYTAYGEFAPPCWESDISYTFDEAAQSGCDGYINNCDATWLLESPAGTVITVEFSEFHTESCCDHLYIHDGTSTSAPTLRVLSGLQNNILPITSSSNRMYLDFSSDYSEVYPGFVFSWTYA